jgi:hypothetical protein
MTLKEESQYMTVMVKNVTADFSLTMDLSTSTMMQMRFLLLLSLIQMMLPLV